jgi:hypothetical protein
VKEIEFGCRWISVCLRIGTRDETPPPEFRRYRVASRRQTTELRETLGQKLSAALKKKP